MLKELDGKKCAYLITPAALSHSGRDEIGHGVFIGVVVEQKIVGSIAAGTEKMAILDKHGEIALISPERVKFSGSIYNEIEAKYNPPI